MTGRPATEAPGGTGTSGAAPARDKPRAGEPARAARRRAILDLVATRAIGSQDELAALLGARGFAVTQATVSRDIADLGLVKAPRGGRHAYVTPEALAGGGGSPPDAGGPGQSSVGGEARLRRILADYPVTVARSGLTLVLVSRPGAAAAIAQAIDEWGLDDQVGTLAGDNTLLVLFADEPALERWRARFGAAAAAAAAGLAATDLTSTYP